MLLSEPANLYGRQSPPRPVDHVREVDGTRSRSNQRGIGIDNRLIVVHQVKGREAQHQSLAFRALLPSVDHAGIVPIAQDNLVTSCKRHAENGDTQRLCCTSVKRDLTGIAVHQLRELALRRDFGGVQLFEKIEAGVLVREAKGFEELSLNRQSSGANAAIVQIYVGFLSGIKRTNCFPV